MTPWYKEWPCWVVIMLIAGILGLIALSIQSQTRFNAFVKQHNCKAIAQDPGSYMTILSPIQCGNGCTTYVPIITYVEGPKTWRCDGMKDFKR